MLLKLLVLTTVVVLAFLSQDTHSQSSEDDHDGDKEEWLLYQTVTDAHEYTKYVHMISYGSPPLLLISNEGPEKTIVARLLTSRIHQYSVYQLLVLAFEEDTKCLLNYTTPYRRLYQFETPLYQLPSFDNCPHNSTEASNALFFKRLAFETNKLKILFIVDYKKLLESREYLQRLVRNTLRSFNSLSKFKDAIGLAATNVPDTDVTDSDATETIRESLATHRDELSSVQVTSRTDDWIRTETVHVIDSLLADGKNGRSKICIFRDTTNVSEWLQARDALLDLQWYGLEPAIFNASDFNYSLNPQLRAGLESLSSKVKFLLTVIGWQSNSAYLALLYRNRNKIQEYYLSPRDDPLERERLWDSVIIASRQLDQVLRRGNSTSFWLYDFVEPVKRRYDPWEGPNIQLAIMDILLAPYDPAKVGINLDRRATNTVWKEYSAELAGRNITNWYQALIHFHLVFCPELLLAQPNYTNSLPVCRTAQANQSLTLTEEKCSVAQKICMDLAELDDSGITELGRNSSTAVEDEELFRLLKDADRRTRRLVDKYNDIVLLADIGSSEGTATTIGKILSTDCTELEVYFSQPHGQYLIRDLGGSNPNEGSNVAQASEGFARSCEPPQFMTNSETGTVFYEIPNFGKENCSEAFELEQILFFRRLVNRASSIKILLVVDADSLVGKDRVRKQQVANRLQNVADTLWEISNFNNSIGLVVTQLKAIEQEADVSNMVKQSLLNLTKEGPSERLEGPSRIARLIDSLVRENEENGRPNIFLTPAPAHEGHLSDLPEMMDMRANLAQIISHELNRNLTASFSSSDFNIPLTSENLRNNLESILNSTYSSSDLSLGPLLPDPEKVLNNETISDVSATLRNAYPPFQLEWLMDNIILKCSSERLDVDRRPTLSPALSQSTPPVTPLKFGKAMSNYMRSTRRIVDETLVPSNYSKWVPVSQRLLQQEDVVHAIYEINGEISGEDALKPDWRHGDISTLDALDSFQNRFCPELEVSLTGPGLFCNNATATDGHNSTFQNEAMQKFCSLAILACAGWDELERL